MFYKFSKGKAIYSVPNGLGDGSAYFDQTEAVIANIDNLPYGNSARTISCWIYPSRYVGYNHTYFSYGTKSPNLRYGLACNSDGTAIEVYGANNTTAYSYDLPIKNWYHVVITFNNDYTEQCYVNGVLVGTQTHSNINTVKNEAKLGRTANDNTQTDWFYGNIKDLNVYNRVLSANEVTALYNKQEITSGLVLNVPLTYGKDDESMFTSKNFVYDYSIVETSSGFDEFGYPIRFRSASGAGISYATLNKNLLLHHTFTELNADTGQVFTIPREEPIFTTFGGVKCCNFTSKNLIVTMDFADLENAIIASQEMSLSLWVHSTANYYRQHWGSVFGSYFCTLFFNKNEDALTWAMNDKYRVNISYKNFFNKWTHICVVAKNNVAKLYFDNTFVGEITDFGTFAQKITDINVGGDPGGEYNSGLKGYMADLRLYGRALTDKEIQTLAKEF